MTLLGFPPFRLVHFCARDEHATTTTCDMSKLAWYRSIDIHILVVTNLKRQGDTERCGIQWNAARRLAEGSHAHRLLGLGSIFTEREKPSAWRGRARRDRSIGKRCIWVSRGCTCGQIGQGQLERCGLFFVLVRFPRCPCAALKLGVERSAKMTDLFPCSFFVRRYVATGAVHLGDRWGFRSRNIR